MREAVTISAFQRRRPGAADIDAVCEQFSRASGWQLRFVPGEAQPGSIVRFDPPQSANWHVELRDGQHLLGCLELSDPTGSANELMFGQAQQMASVVEDLLSQVLVTSRALESRTQELASVIAHAADERADDDPLPALTQCLRACLQLTGFHAACFFRLDPRHNALRLRLAHHIDPRDVPRPLRPLRETPPDLQSLCDGTRTIVRDDLSESADWLPRGIRLGLCLPVQTGAGPLGTLWLFDRRLRNVTNDDQRICDALNLQFAVLLERLVWSQQRDMRDRWQKEMRSVIEARATEDVPQSLATTALDIAWRSSSRFEVGGDLCEAVALPNHSAALMVGDATGNSLPAAIVQTAVQGALEALLAEGGDSAHRPAEVLTRVNQALLRTCRAQQFMSLLYGIYDASSRRLHYASAGHPAPLLLRGPAVMPLESRGFLLGITVSPEFCSDSIALQPDDVLVLFSDGISEGRNRSGELWGPAGLLQAIGDPRATSAADLLSRAWHAAAKFASLNEVDDRCLMVVRVLAD